MSDPVVVALIVGFPAALAAITAAILSLRNGTAVDKLRQQVDGRLTELLESTRRLALAQGRAAERADPTPPPAAPLPPIPPGPAVPEPPP